MFKDDPFKFRVLFKEDAVHEYYKNDAYRFQPGVAQRIQKGRGLNASEQRA